MSWIRDLLDRIAADPSRELLAFGEHCYSAQWFVDDISKQKEKLNAVGVTPGTVVALEADFSPAAVATFLAILDSRAICVLCSNTSPVRYAEIAQIADIQVHFRMEAGGQVQITAVDGRGENPLYDKLRQTGHAGLVLFTSGTSGKSKGVVHDFERLTTKFHASGRPYRALAFYPMDHIGALDVLFGTLASRGVLVMADDRTPDTVLAAVESHRVELMPVSPTFMNMVLLSEAHLRHDVSSLKIVAFGAEPIPQTTWNRCREIFPRIRFIQTYGMSEMGTLRTRSPNPDTLWIDFDKNQQDIRVVDGMLQVRSPTMMLGYINAPDPFTDDGWLKTGDAVAVHGEHVRVLGRKSESINVGGEKVYPAEIENVILAMDGVADVSVYGEPNTVMGNIVCASVQLASQENRREFTTRLKQFCSGRLERFKVPVRVELVSAQLPSGRFKKSRIPIDLPGQ